MTFPPIYLIEVRALFYFGNLSDTEPTSPFPSQRIGRRSLITISTFGALVSLLGVGYGIDGGHIVLASAAIITFVA